MTKKEIQQIREYYPGIIGGKKVAQKATDVEIEYLVQLGEKYKELFNQADDLKRQFYNLIGAIEMR